MTTQGTGDVTTVAAMTTQGSDDECLVERYWFYFLASSLIVFFAGIIVIFVWRIVEYLLGCRWPPTVRRRGRPGNSDSETATFTTKIKCECEKLVSGQTAVGRVMVSSHVLHFLFIVNVVHCLHWVRVIFF